MNEDDARRKAQAFAREVEAALVDLPRHRRVELTAGLVDHLLEPGDDEGRLIDEALDPTSYAEELRASAPPTSDRPRGRRSIYLAGAALIVLVAVAVGVWAGVTHPWSREAIQAEPTPTTTTTSEVAQTQVPEVRTLSREQALTLMESVGLTADVILLPDGEEDLWPTYLPSGVVAATDPPGGTLVEVGTRVTIMLAP